MTRRPRAALAWAFALVTLASTVALPPASAATPYTNIMSLGPLSEIMLGKELSCQARHVQDSVDEFYPPMTRPGDCGTFLAADSLLYSPDFRAHGSTATGNLGSYLAWTPVSQSDPSGAGTAPNPFRVTTVADAGVSGLRITQTDSYVVGERFYRSDITVSYTGGGSKSVILYRAGDCYLGGSDTGFGFLDTASGTIGCATNPNDVPTDRYIKWIPITGGSRYYQSFYGSVWQWIGSKTPFPDTCACGDYQDNGAGLSWSFSIPSGGSVTRSHYTSFGVPARPVFEDPSPCIAGEPIRGAVGVPLSFDLRAAEADDTRTLSLSLLPGGPAGLTLSPGPAANPTQGVASWPDPVQGIHTAEFRATDNIGQTVDCLVVFDIRPPEGQATALAAWAGTAVPESVEWRTTGVDLHAPGAAVRRTLVADLPDVQLYLDAAEETGSVVVAGRNVSTRASTQIAHARLLGGIVELRGLENEATVTYDPRSATGGTIANASSIGSLTVNGAPVPLTGGPQTILLPNGAELRLHERESRLTPAGVLYREDLVRAYLPTPYGRTEVILGTIILQGAGTVDPLAQRRAILAQDDARSGGDAGDDLATAHPLLSGVYDGTVSEEDRVDVYKIPVSIGENVKVVVASAARATVAGGSVTLSKTPPPPVAPTPAVSRLHDWQLSLYDPTHTERDRYFADVDPLTVELNADVTGEWYIEVRANSIPGDGARNYTLALAVAPAPLLPEAETGGLGDAPAQCAPGGAGLPELRRGVSIGVIGVADDVDVYRFHADLGELASLVLKPGEDANAVAMDLAIYDDACTLLARHSDRMQGAKGMPQLHEMLPVLRGGAYIVAVERVNGIGNYALTLAVANPIPTLPANDAGTGHDAPADPSDPSTPLAPAAFEGRIDDGDDGDAYRVPLVMGRHATLAVHTSAMSHFDVTLRAPSGAIVQPASVPNADVYAWKALETGAHTLVVRATQGGGNYLVAWGQAPA